MTTTIRYRTLDPHRGNPARRVEVDASEQDLAALAADGYLARHGMLADRVGPLGAALAEVEADERRAGDSTASGAFGGFFARHLQEKHEAFRDLATDPALVGVARAMLGPAVRLGQVTARVTYPGEPGQETCWHVHRRVIPEPRPAWFEAPNTMDVLVYLDATDRETGPLAVVPGTHRVTNATGEQPGADDVDDKPGQVTLELPAGSVVFMHSNLWHRGMPTTPEGRKRRLLIVSYMPAWYRGPAIGDKPTGGLGEAMRGHGDEAVRELFGVGGYV